MRIEEIEAALRLAKNEVGALCDEKRLVFPRPKDLSTFTAEAFFDGAPTMRVCERTLSAAELQALADFIADMFGIRAKEAGER